MTARRFTEKSWARAMRKIAISVAALLVFLVALAFLQESVRGDLSYVLGRAGGGHTLEERLDQYGPRVAERLRRSFEGVGLSYPPYEVAYVAFKDSRVLELYARMSTADPWRFVKQYPVLAASGGLGPKLAEGDSQVPEGLYQAEYLNPNSRFHLSIRLNYPNEFDKRMAARDGRAKLGGDIMIHGNSVSIGCLAMGDQAAEDLFILAGLVSKKRVQILISPTDFRRPTATPLPEEPAWVRSLYMNIRAALRKFSRGT